MGIEVNAISNAKWARCDDEEGCDDTHFYYSPVNYRKLEGLKVGCYVVGKAGCSFYALSLGYDGYHQWRCELAKLALGLRMEEIWENPRRFRGKPFMELLRLPDYSGIAIGPFTSKKLAVDFANFSEQAESHYSAKRPMVKNQKNSSKSKAADNKSKMNAAQRSAESLAQKLGGTTKNSRATDINWMWEVYQDFHEAFKIASKRGFLKIS